MCILISHVATDCHLSQEWTKLERPEGVPWPTERSSHAATCLNYADEYPQLLITGGLDKRNKTLSDTWLLDINTRRWREVREMEGCGVCVCDETKYIKHVHDEKCVHS